MCLEFSENFASTVVGAAARLEREASHSTLGGGARESSRRGRPHKQFLLITPSSNHSFGVAPAKTPPRTLAGRH